MNEELLAKDVLRTLPLRVVVGAALVARVGARAWKAPKFGPGRSLFGRCGIPDPWDPEVEQVDVGLGDVGLKDDRRQPAPHAAPPPPPGTAAPKLPNVPAARPNPSPDAAKGRPAPQIGATRKVEAGELKPKTESVTTRPKAPPKREQPPSAFGGGPVHHAVAKLPVRPNIGSVEPPAPVPVEAPMSLGTGLGVPRAPGVPSGTGGSSVAARPTPASGSLGSRPTAPEVPEWGDPTPISRPSASGGAPPSPSGAAPVNAASRPPTTGQNAPLRPASPATAAATVPSRPAPPRLPPPNAPLGGSVESTLASGASRSPDTGAPAAPKPAAPINRRPPSAGGGMDDFFGMGGGENTRIKLSRTPEGGEPPRARKLTVTNPDDLAQQGIDRRPPPPKPPPAAPGVAPAAKPSSARSDDDLPDE